MATSASNAERLKAELRTGAMRAMHGGTSIRSSLIAEAVLNESERAASKNLEKAV